jgi:hypothetical protein
MGGIEALNDGASSRYEREAAAIEGLSDIGAVATTSTTAAGPTTTTTAPPATTTTAPPATTTTTTAPPATTTTTAPPGTTTTTAATGQYTTIADVKDVSKTKSGKWEARLEVTVENQDGNPVDGAYVAVRFVAANGATYGANCETEEGYCTASWTDRVTEHSPMDAEVNAVIASPGWDGVLQSITLFKP